MQSLASLTSLPLVTAPSPSTGAEPATYVENADSYVRCPVSTEVLDGRLEKLARAHHGSGSSPVELNPKNGAVDLIADADVANKPADEAVLPLRLDALSKGLHEIGRMDPWLLDRDPVFYVDKQGKAHIDYTNLAGFVVDPVGTIVFRSVNPW